MRRHFIRQTLPVLAIALSLFIAGAASAQQTLYVDDDTCPAQGSGSQGDPLCKIQDAICQLIGIGGEVLVSPGVYNESLRMHPGISVISIDGPETTTIDATGQACTRFDCQPSTINLSCSVVVIGSNVTNADRLEGFRLTGGTGLFRQFDEGAEPADAIVGGGIMIFNSSPTITNNIISDNWITGGGTGNFWGGGIYIGGGDSPTPAYPVITRNLIENNTAIPGDTQVSGFGIGGGIYAGVYSASNISFNSIIANQAGNTISNTGLGGGIASYSIIETLQPVISSNLVENNTSTHSGGGLFFSPLYYDTGTSVIYYPSQGRVENNVLTGNIATYNGGGVISSPTQIQLINNTIVFNTSEFGGGIALYDSSEPDQQAELVNNIIAFNTATVYPGGGVGTFLAYPSMVLNNDLHGNQPDQIGGHHVDADFIGIDGNIDANPKFVGGIPGSLDPHLDATSPAIDAGNNDYAGLLDFDEIPRVLDGNGDDIAIVDIGAHELQADNDGDGLPDWSDPDDDDDGVEDGEDCRPFHGGVARAPASLEETLFLDKHDPAGATLTWTRRAREGHTFNVYRGSLQADQPWEFDESCLVAEIPEQETSDADLPASTAGYYYLVSTVNSCGESEAGRRTSGLPTVPTPSCASPGLDSDDDGEPDLSDNCPLLANPDQADADHDFAGDVCDLCPGLPDVDQSDSDRVLDPPGDAVGDACDNCALLTNVTQSDLDGDNQGDRCDLDDDQIYLVFPARDRFSWDAETGYESWNTYRGDLNVLRSSGIYTQMPESNPLASSTCRQPNNSMPDDVELLPMQTAFYLTSGWTGTVEGSLGPGINDIPRPNSNPCP